MEEDHIKMTLGTHDERLRHVEIKVAGIEAQVSAIHTTLDEAVTNVAKNAEKLSEVKEDVGEIKGLITGSARTTQLAIAVATVVIALLGWVYASPSINFPT